MGDFWENVILAFLGKGASYKAAVFYADYICCKHPKWGPEFMVRRGEVAVKGE